MKNEDIFDSMLRRSLSILCVVLHCFCNAKAVMPQINSSLFINGGKTDLFSLLKSSDSPSVKSKIEKLFNEDQFDHPFSKAYDSEAKFNLYWEKNRQYWYTIDLNRDGKDELLYQVIATNLEEIEFVEIYSKTKGQYKLFYKESGHFIAYKIHSNTKEIILFHHQYPCCSNASHNINMVRLIGNQIKLRKKYFLARDEGMKGDFFPKNVSFKSNYHYLTKNTIIRWSSEKISKNAWGMYKENKLANYPKGTPYRILARKGLWSYIEICGEPIIQKKNPYEFVINSTNFNDVHVFGWIYLNV